MSALGIEELKARVAELGPWHMDIEIRDGVRTATNDVNADSSKAPSLRDPGKHVAQVVRKVYRGKLSGQSFLDIACNGGGNSFGAKDVGAGEVLGFDVRDHWIDQANFIRLNRAAPSDRMEFRVMDLYDLDGVGDRKWDISWFSGIFYHLPDPVRGLKIVADRTKELLYVSTATSALTDPEPPNGCLHAAYEGTDYIMTGVYGLNWFPSGPNVMRHMFKWLGFPESRLLYWRKRIVDPRRARQEKKVLGRLAMVAARDPALLKHMRDAEPIEMVNRDIASDRDNWAKRT
ncbi:MAG: class I SAM-dependent methyltransferase [Pseudomonadota bacterium]